MDKQAIADAVIKHIKCNPAFNAANLRQSDVRDVVYRAVDSLQTPDAKPKRKTKKKAA